jgi:cell division protein FtsI (penicillin-binding protein 3)
MGKQLQRKRFLLLVTMLVGAFALLALRLVDLQVLRHAELRVRAQQNTVRRIQIPPRRGDILDIRGNLLASSAMVKSVCANPSLIGTRQAEVARAIAPLLGLNEAHLYQKLLQTNRVNERGETVPRMYVALTNRVSTETWEKVKQVMATLPVPDMDQRKLSAKEKSFLQGLRKRAIAVEEVDDQLRKYPHGALAAHVLGFVGRNGDTNSVEFGQMIGVDGIERTFDEKLAGTMGWRMTERDGSGNEVVALRDQDVPARDGFNVVLTIDSVVQNILEDVLTDGMEKYNPDNITGIVLRPRTGEILAMASLPDYDPNRVPSNPELRRNRLIGDVCEPGSTFKVVPVSGALNERLVKLGDVFDCERGAFQFAGRTLHDSHGGHGALTVEGIITKSSNIGAAKIGIKLGADRLFDYMCDFGFGMPTGIPLPAESRGILHPVNKWSKVSIAQIPMGHGVAVTRLQMVMAMAVVANDGWLMRPMLVNRVQDSAGHVMTQYQPQRVRQVISAATAKQMVQALKTVTEPGGTATLAALTNYTVAGKTGTAQKPGKGGYLPGKYIASFIGFFPADNPEVCISIVLDEPSKNGYYGGVVAAPVFREAATAVASYLHIQPDIGPAITNGVSHLPGAVAENRPGRLVSTRTARTP